MFVSCCTWQKQWKAWSHMTCFYMDRGHSCKSVSHWRLMRTYGTKFHLFLFSMELNWSSVSYVEFLTIDLFSIKTAWWCFSALLGAKTILFAAVVGVVLEGNSGALRQDRRDESTRQEHSIVGEVNRCFPLQISKLKENLHGNPSCHVFPLSLCTMTQHFQTNIVLMLPYDAIVIGSLTSKARLSTRCSGSTKAWRI